MYGESPYVQYLKLVHDDIPRLVIPVRLQQGVPVTFQARIIARRSYDLNLLVFFSKNEQRTAVDELIGGPITQPKNEPKPPGRLQPEIHLTVLNQDGQIVHDRTVESDGRIETTVIFVGRGLDRLLLAEGLYTITVTPISDVSSLAPFRTQLELTYVAK